MSRSTYYYNEHSKAIQKYLGKTEKVANTEQHITKMIEANNKLVNSVVHFKTNEMVLENMIDLKKWAKSLLITCEKYETKINNIITSTNGFNLDMVERLPYDMIWYINQFLQYRQDKIIGKKIAMTNLWNKIAKLKEHQIKMFFYYSVAPYLKSGSNKRDMYAYDRECLVNKFFGLCKKDALELLEKVLNGDQIKVKQKYIQTHNLSIDYKVFSMRAEYVYDNCINKSKADDKKIKDKYIMNKDLLKIHIEKRNRNYMSSTDFVW